jgi:hypothetical protein
MLISRILIRAKANPIQLRQSEPIRQDRRSYVTEVQHRVEESA